MGLLTFSDVWVWAWPKIDDGGPRMLKDLIILSTTTIGFEFDHTLFLQSIRLVVWFQRSQIRIADVSLLCSLVSSFVPFAPYLRSVQVLLLHLTVRHQKLSYRDKRGNILEICRLSINVGIENCTCAGN